MTRPINTFYQDHPQFKPKLDGMTSRIIVELALKILCNFWRTLGSYFSTVAVPEHSKELVGNQGAVLSELRHKRTVGPATIQEYITTVHPDIGFVSSFLFNLSSSELPDLDDKDLIFIPTVLKSGVRDHIVAVVYDRVNNRVELYDPKGLVALDRGDWVRGEDKMMLINVLQKVALEYGDANTTLWENTRKDQYDSHNCGIHVLNYIKQRAEGKSPVEVKGLSFSEANGSFRKALMFNFLNKLPENSTESSDLLTF